jgi:hypothetical protein
MLRKLAASTLLLCACASAFGALGKPMDGVVVAYRLPSGMTPAAVASEMWSRPPSISRFRYGKLYLACDRHTDLRAAYDDKNLYLAYKTILDSSYGPLVAKSKTGMKGVLNDDSAVAVIDTDDDYNTFFCFGVNSAGARYAESVKQFIHKQIYVPWTAQSKLDKTSWTALMTIPFTSLGVSTPKPGAEWSVNFDQSYKDGRQPSMWMKAVRRAWDIRCRGKMVFGGEDWTFVSIPDLKIDTPGWHGVKLSIINPGSTSESLVWTAVVDGRPIEPGTLVVSSGKSEVEIGLDYPFDGWHDVNLEVADSTGRVLARTAPIATRVPAHWSSTELCRRLIATLEPVTEAAKAEKASVEKQLSDVVSQARDAVGDGAKWAALGPKVESLEKATAHLRCACADPDRRGYAVGTETALRKIMPEKLFEGEFGNPLKLSLARNEFESAQAVVIAHEKALKGVAVSISDLRGPNGGVIPASRVQLNLVDFVKTGEPPYEIDYIGWYPDPLIDLKPFDLAKGAIRPVWVTVHAPTGIPSGKYSGTLTIRPANAPETKLPVEVGVWDFDLPTRLQMKTAFAFAEGELTTWYGKPVTNEQRLEWYQMLLDHHINPTNIYSKIPVPRFEDMGFCVDRGMNAFNLTVTWGKSDEKLKELLNAIAGYKKPLAEKGWWDLAYVYGFDELGPDRFDDLNKTYGAIGKAFPELPRMTTIVPCEELKGSVDIWVPLTGNYDPDWCNKFVKEGDQVWWYICCHPLHPYPNFFVDYPAIDPRILFWMNWKYQVPGVLYYMMNLWESNRSNEGKGIHPNNDPKAQKAIAAGKRWPEVPWNTHTCAGFNGDGHLLYPGPNGKPYSSIRLESIRDGIEDYEYFHILDELVKKTEATTPNSPLLDGAKKLLTIRDDIVASTSEYTLDPAALLGVRSQLAGTIEAMSGQ